MYAARLFHLYFAKMMNKQCNKYKVSAYFFRCVIVHTSLLKHFKVKKNLRIGVCHQQFSSFAGLFSQLRRYKEASVRSDIQHVKSLHNIITYITV